MRIFISGVAGFLGSHLADAFIADGHKVVGCDNLIGGYFDNVPNQVEFHLYDCTDLRQMINVTKGCDIVFHCAATAYEGLSSFSPTFITNNIVQSSISVITASIINKVRRFVFCSSMARYGTQKIIPFTEDLTPLPQDPYGIGKYCSELMLSNLSKLHGMEYVIAVPHNIIGPRQRYDDPYRNVASIMINMLLQGKQPFIYGDGTQKRCFSFIQDDVEMLKLLAFLPNISGEVINIGPDDEFITINELFHTIASLLHSNITPIYLTQRPQEVYLASCSSTKAKRLLGYESKTKLVTGLKTMIDYISTRGTRPFKYFIDLEIINQHTPLSWKNRMF